MRCGSDDWHSQAQKKVNEIPVGWKRVFGDRAREQRNRDANCDHCFRQRARNAYAKPETGQIKIEFASASVVRFEVDDNTVIASHRRFQNSGSSTIVYYGDAGENNGRSLRHDFVVLSLDHQKLASSPQEFHLPSSAPENASRPNRTALAAWITSPGDITPLQATGGWLPPSSGEGH